MSIERRMTTGQPLKIETRADKGKMITGYAAVFYRAANPGTQYELMSDMYERIDRSAFNRALSEKDDARALFNHDPNFVLGRTASGTLRLSEGDDGLEFECDLPDTTYARAEKRFGKQGVVDLTGVNAYYTLLAMQLNMAQYEPPKDAKRLERFPK